MGQKKPVGAHFPTFYLHFYPKDGIIAICNGVDMVRELVGLAVLEVYSRNNVIWQGDSARIHRCKAAITVCSKVFKKCVSHEMQGAKMADIGAIENVLSIIRNDLMKYELRNKEHFQ